VNGIYEILAELGLCFENVRVPSCWILFRIYDKIHYVHFEEKQV